MVGDDSREERRGWRSKALSHILGEIDLIELEYDAGISVVQRFTFAERLVCL